MLTADRGDVTQTVPIQLDGVQVQVTVNLEQFLRQLLSTPFDEDHLYVDALCIDQTNATEASQVSMMGFIYANAKMVYAWLDLHHRPVTQPST